MKLFKTLVLGAAVAVSLANVSQAATRSFYIAGSSAFRAQLHTAIMNLLGSTDYNPSTGTGTVPSGTNPDNSHAYGYAFSGSATNLGGATNAIFYGKINGEDVIVHTTWTGSESGIYSIAIDSGAGANVNFIPDTATTSTTGVNNTAATDPHVPDAAMSDTFQSSSQWFGGASITYADSSVHTVGTLTEVSGGAVGVTYFTFAVSKSGKDDGITNITSEHVKYLYKSGVGSVPVTMFVPTYSGTGAKVYAMGRDPDSGTRLSTFGETGIGLLGSTSQYYAYDSSNAVIQSAGTPISYIKPVPAATVNNVAVGLGNSGYSSGGNLVKAANNEAGDQVSTNPFRLNSTGGTQAPIGSCLIVYAGIADANNMTAGQKLTFNGVAATDANVQNGTYPLWTYEHMYLRTGADSTVATAIANSLRTTYAAGTGCVLRSSMKVQRIAGSKDGGSLIQPGTF